MQAQDGLAEGGLAAAGFAHQAEALAAAHLQVHAVHGAHVGDVVAEDPAAHRVVLLELPDVDEGVSVVHFFPSV